jgi:hypothetical protein
MRLARRTLPLAPLLVCLVLLPACVAGPVAVLGETGPPPPGLAGPLPQVQVLVVDDEGKPVADAAVRFDGTAPVVTGSDGLAAVDWSGRPVEVNARGPGLRPASAQIESLIEEPLEVMLQPVVLNGRVVTEAGKPITGVEVTLGEKSTVTDDAGRFTLRRATKGELTAWMPAWEQARVPWDGRSRRVTVEMSPLMVRGLHVAGWLPANSDVWPGLVDLVERTELNALVVDIKDESGSVFHDSEVEVATRAGALKPEYDIEELADELHERDLYLIGRIVAFQDPIAARAIPAMAIRDTEAHEPYNNNGQWFLDPTDEKARQYALDLAVEACRGGFDEIQFDYVRFPDGYPANVRFDGPADESARVSTINAFLETAEQTLNEMGCAVAADIFGFIISIENDGGIGQRLEELAQSVDVVSPMVYPSHYSTGWFQKECPNDHPHDTVAGALDDGLPRLPATAVLRPWIQDFDGSYACGSTGKTVTQVQSQIQAATDRGLGYMVWNAASSFTEDAFRLEE